MINSLNTPRGHSNPEVGDQVLLEVGCKPDREAIVLEISKGGYGSKNRIWAKVLIRRAFKSKTYVDVVWLEDIWRFLD